MEIPQSEPRWRFVLSSSDFTALRYPRLCYAIGGPRILGRPDQVVDDAAMVVRVDPISPGGDWTGRGEVKDPRLREYLVLQARYKTAPIWDLDASDLWARPVYAYRVNDWDVLNALAIGRDMLGRINVGRGPPLD